MQDVASGASSARAPTLMSAAALVLGHGSHEHASGSRRSRGSSVGGCKPRQLRLAVQRERAASAVGAAELADGAVTAQKLARGVTLKLADAAITADKLDGWVSSWPSLGSAGTLAGEVDELGALVRGGRFTARVETGEYTILLRPASPRCQSSSPSLGSCELRYVLSQSVSVGPSTSSACPICSEARPLRPTCASLLAKSGGE